MHFRHREVFRVACFVLRRPDCCEDFVDRFFDDFLGALAEFLLPVTRADFFLVDRFDLVVARPAAFFVDLRRCAVLVPPFFVADFFLAGDPAARFFLDFLALLLVRCAVLARPDFFVAFLAAFFLPVERFAVDDPPPKMLSQFSENFSVEPTRTTLILFILLTRTGPPGALWIGRRVGRAGFAVAKSAARRHPHAVLEPAAFGHRRLTDSHH